jgi:cell division septum initiation protein DivIVA
MRENEDLRKENEELKIRVGEVERQKAELSPAVLRMLDGIFDPAPKDPVFPRRTVAATTTKIVRPSQSTRTRAPRPTTVKNG